MHLDNWPEIAKAVGSLDSSGQERSSSNMALQAIEMLIGEDKLREAVHYYLSRRQGGELLRAVLWQLHPYSAMQECYDVFRNSQDPQEKRDAIELLRVVADARAIKWIPEFLQSDDEGIQNWAIGIVDQLIFSGLCHEEDVGHILKAGTEHANEYVREKTAEIIALIGAAEARDRIIREHLNQEPLRGPMATE